MKKNRLSVYTWPSKKSWYLKHPLSWIKELFYNIHCARQRVRHGYCDMDWYNFCYWFLDVVPCMLRDIANRGYSYPALGEYDSKEKWEEFLLNLADSFDRCKEDNLPKNEHLAEFDAMLNEYGSSENFTLQGKIVKNKYMQREKEIAEERRRILADAFRLLSENFFNLWD